MQDRDIKIPQKSRIQIKKFPDINKTVIVFGKKVPTVQCTYRKRNKLRWSFLCMQLLGVLLTCAVAVGADAVNV